MTTQFTAHYITHYRLYYITHVLPPRSRHCRATCYSTPQLHHYVCTFSSLLPTFWFAYHGYRTPRVLTVDRVQFYLFPFTAFWTAFGLPFGCVVHALRFVVLRVTPHFTRSRIAGTTRFTVAPLPYTVYLRLRSQFAVAFTLRTFAAPIPTPPHPPPHPTPLPPTYCP